MFLEYFKQHLGSRVFSIIDIFYNICCNRFTVLLKFTVNLKDFSSYRIKIVVYLLILLFPANRAFFLRIPFCNIYTSLDLYLCTFSVYCDTHTDWCFSIFKQLWFLQEKQYRKIVSLHCHTLFFDGVKIFEKSLFYAKRRESVKYNPIRWTCFYVEIKSTYFTSSKMRYSGINVKTWGVILIKLYLCQG